MHAEKWLLIYFDISCMIINRRLRIGIKNARWYIGTTGGNNEVFASFIRFTSNICNEYHGAALEYVLVCINESGTNPWKQMKQAVVV